MSNENNSNRNVSKWLWNLITGETALNKREVEKHHKNLEPANNIDLEVKPMAAPVENQPEIPVLQKKKEVPVATEELKAKLDSSKKDKTPKLDQSKVKPKLSATSKKELSMINSQIEEIAEQEKAQIEKREREHRSNLEKVANLYVKKKNIIDLDEKSSKDYEDFLARAEKLSQSPKEV